MGAGRIIVVAGTDTEIGKTTAGCALLYALRQQGQTVRGIKPVESGTDTQARPTDEDGRRLACAAAQDEPVEALQRLRAPLAPPVAARDEGVELRPRQWMETISRVAAGADLTLVEGAGGLLSPLADGFDTRDLAGCLEAPVLLVASDRLGTLNHTFLTMEALRSRGVGVVGVIFCAPKSSDASTGRNASVVATRSEGLPVVTLPRIDGDAEGAGVLESSPLMPVLLADAP